MPHTAYTKNQFRRHVFGTAAMAKPAHLYCALFTDAGVEVSAGTYARVQRDASDANWTFPAAPNDGEANNTADITFPAPGGVSWGNITTVHVFDAAVGGNDWGVGTITPKTINAGDPAPNFPAGTFKATFK